MAEDSQSVKLSMPNQIIKNIKGMRFNLMELSGGLGDLGTFIPLVAALAVVSGMDLGAILIFAGLFNIATGIMFGLPIPVQPMKAIAAVAIAEQLLPAEIAAAGLIAGAVVFLLGVTKLIDKVEKIVPIAVIRGIQLGVGLKLILKAFDFISATPLWGLNSIIVAGLIAVVVLLMKPFPKAPSALIIFILGLIILFYDNFNLLNSFSFSLPSLSLTIPDANNYLNGFLYGAIPQIPLTILNSVLAVCVLSGDLFPGKKVPTTKMATSVGLMNLVGCWFGAMPMCHGSGGLAGQYHFGARSGGSVLILGIGKLLVGLFLGGFAMSIIGNYPMSILGVMLFFAGIELAMPARDQKKAPEFLVMVVTVGGILAVNTLVGVLLGLLFYVVLKKLSIFS